MGKDDKYLTWERYDVNVDIKKWSGKFKVIDFSIICSYATLINFHEVQ